ncbi:DUF4266 domain-containing protein [Nannocystaceae bacterium ST9]
MSALLLVSALLDYSSPSSYAQPASPEGGGGGRWFTGSPAEGYDCSVCHAGGPPLELEIHGLPLAGWDPGSTYELQIAWAEPDAHVALLTEFVRADGSGIGRVELAPEPLLLPEERCAGGPRAAKLHELDPTRQIVSLGDCGARLLRMQWTAPDHADDDAWLFLAGVHADASDDPHGDGVMLQSIRLPGPASSSARGCELAESSPRGGLALLGLLALALVRPRRGRAAALMLALLVAGCARVPPHQRGRLAAPDMQMELDPELCAGRTHAVEYREGSAGGLGSGGGGCGCN